MKINQKEMENTKQRVKTKHVGEGGQEKQT